MIENNANPFLLTKSAHLSADEIAKLWIEFSPEPSGGASFFSPTSPMPTIVIGGKGSGKSHLLRYYSFEVQKLRFADVANIESKLKEDGYIGIYTRASGLNAERFKGSTVDEELWSAAFSYFVELWLAQELVAILDLLQSDLPELHNQERKLATRASRLFGDWGRDEPSTFAELSAGLEAAQKEIENHVNNAPFSRELDVVIRCSRGALIFGIPKILSNEVPIFEGLLFAYYIDEFENFNEQQQQYINTLVREQELPVTFRIGARAYGMRTYLTLSAGEGIKEGSEFEYLKLDQQFRKDHKAYSNFSRKLIRRRIEYASGAGKSFAKTLDNEFETLDEDWGSPMFVDMFKGQIGEQRRHFSRLVDALENAPKRRQPKDINNAEDVEHVVKCLSHDDYPLLEKTGVYLFFQAWSKNKPLIEAASSIQKLANDYLAGDRKNKFAVVLSHFKNDFISQIRRETFNHQVYAGIDTFIEMSEGLPRALITLLKFVYSWSSFRREEPFRGGRISVDAQMLGVNDAAEWFLNDMRIAGEDGGQIRSAINRLGELFRINHFADKPSECSLISFSVDLTFLEEEAQKTLTNAENRSFLIRISSGERDRNTKKVTAKYQLSRMVCPFFELPVSRRGTARLDPDDANSIFINDRQDDFGKLVKLWEARLNAPFPAARRRKTKDGVPSLNDRDLFD